MGADRLIAAPNPMRSSGAIDYAIIERGHVRLALVDLLGREVRILVDGAQDAGLHTIGIDVTGITPGIYFLRMRHGGESIVRRIVVE